MAPVLNTGHVALSEKNPNLERGSVFAYRDGTTVRYSRVIAEPNVWVNIMSDGTLLISDEQLKPYRSAYLDAIKKANLITVNLGSNDVLSYSMKKTLNILSSSSDCALAEEVKEIIESCHAKAKELISAHKYVLDRCAALLMEREKLGREEFEAIFGEENAPAPAAQ